MNNMQKSFKAKGLRAGGKYDDGLISVAANGLRNRQQQIDDAVNGTRPAAPAPVAQPAPVARQAAPLTASQMDAVRGKPRGILGGIFGYADGGIPLPKEKSVGHAVTYDRAGAIPIKEPMNTRRSTWEDVRRGAVIPGHDTTGRDDVDVKVTRGEAILPVKTVDAMGGPEAVGQLIQSTNGKAPAGLKAAGGKYAGGYIDTEPSLYEKSPMSTQGNLLQRGGSMNQMVYVPTGEKQYVAPDVAAHNAEIGRQQVSNHEKYRDHQWVGGRDGEWQAPAGLKAAGAPSVSEKVARNPLKLGWDTKEEFNADPMVQAGMGGVGSIASVGSRAASLSKGLWQGAKKLFAGGSDDAAQGARPGQWNSKPEGLNGDWSRAQKIRMNREASGMATPNLPSTEVIKPGLFKQAIQKERAWVKENPWKARTVVPAAIGGGALGVISAIGDEQPQAAAQAPALNPQAAAQAQAKAAEKQQLMQAARVKLGLSPYENGDVYSPEERAAITQAQGEWLGRNGISAEDQAQPAQSYEQANMNSRQTGGKNGLEAAKNYKLQYGPNSQIYGRSDRADGKINNFTGIGDGSTWESRNPQAHQDAVQRAAELKQGLHASIMAQASSGEHSDYVKAVESAARLGDGAMMKAVDAAYKRAGLQAAATARDPAGTYNHQLQNETVMAQHALQRGDTNYWKQQELGMRQQAYDLQRQQQAVALAQYGDTRGDKTFEKVDSRLKSLAMEDGKLNEGKYNQLRTYIEQSLAARNQSLESAGPEMLDELLWSAEKSGVKGRFNTLRSLIGRGDKEVPAHQYGMFKDRKSGWLGDELQRANGDWVPASEIEGGGVGPFAESFDPRGGEFVKRNLQFHKGGA